jgi:serine/threonine protein phosphatase PrpC
VSSSHGSDPVVTCTACGAAGFADELYCEACGAALPAAPIIGPAATAASPPGAATMTAAPAAPDTPSGIPASPPWGTPATGGWATQPSAKERRELVDGPVAAVTDRGITHWRNEDAVGLRWIPGSPGDPGGFVLVVCDGVSRSQEPHLVSQAAVDTALMVLSAAVSAGDDLEAAMIEATAAAQRAASAMPFDPALELGPGACTFVAVAVRGRKATFGSVGDSRAYWVESTGVYQVGRDDSLAAELVASGGYTHAQAMATSGAHALTKWLGFDSIDAEPTLTSVELPGPGLVVLASDGLWNYAPEPAHLASLIGPVGSEGALGLARRLADFAEASGGNDNITVAIGPHDLFGPASEVR